MRFPGKGRGGSGGCRKGNAYVLLDTRPRSISEKTLHPHPYSAPSTDSSLTAHTAVSGYPDLIPFRDPHTWCRMMQHVVVVMSSDAPEFLEALVELNTVALAEAVQYGIISAETRESRANELEVVVEEILAARKAEIMERLRCLCLERNRGTDSADRKGSPQESRFECRAALGSGCGETPEEVSV